MEICWGITLLCVALIVGNTRIRKRVRLDGSMASSIPSESRPDVSEEIDTFLDGCQQEARHKVLKQTE